MNECEEVSGSGGHLLHGRFDSLAHMQMELIFHRIDQPVQLRLLQPRPLQPGITEHPREQAHAGDKEPHTARRPHHLPHRRLGWEHRVKRGPEARAQQREKSDREFVRVAFTPEAHRGGLLTQASILSLTSDGVRHRPVHRGVWLNEAIFGKSPPPPPANVNPIPTNPTGPKATLRQKLEAHIHDPNCAACHRKIDPFGLAFENFDAIGRWRTEEITDGQGANPKVNPAGQMPDGRAYANAATFVERKRHYDPKLLFRNAMWDAYFA